MLLIMAFFKVANQLTKCKHKGISENIDSDNINFSSVKPQQIFQLILNQKILFPECFKTGQTYISGILTLFEYILKIKNKNVKTRKIPSFS